jgi:hypothetical protein
MKHNFHWIHSGLNTKLDSYKGLSGLALISYRSPRREQYNPAGQQLEPRGQTGRLELVLHWLRHAFKINLNG